MHLKTLRAISILLSLSLLLTFAVGCSEKTNEWSHPMFIRAEKYRAAKEFKKAIYYYKKYLLLNPKSAETHRILASLYDDNLHIPLEAIIHYKAYLELADPNSKNYAHYKEWLENAKKKYAEQLTGNNILVQVKKENPEVERINKKNEEKIIAYEKLVKRLRNNIKRVYNYAQRVKAKNKKLVDWIKSNRRYVVRENPKPPPKLEPLKTTSKFILRKQLVKTLFKNSKKKKNSPTKAASRYYTVKPGDSLGKISQKMYGSSKHYLEIYNANRKVIKSPTRLKVGQQLIIPNL